MSHFIEYWQDCGCVANQCRCPGPKETRHRPGSCAKCKPLTVTLADQTGVTSTPTPPDFDAAVDRYVMHFRLPCPCQECAADKLAARQRVRELYEAVVREREALERVVARRDARIVELEQRVRKVQDAVYCTFGESDPEAAATSALLSQEAP